MIRAKIDLKKKKASLYNLIGDNKQKKTSDSQTNVLRGAMIPHGLLMSPTFTGSLRGLVSPLLFRGIFYQLPQVPPVHEDKPLPCRQGLPSLSSEIFIHWYFS